MQRHKLDAITMGVHAPDGVYGVVADVGRSITEQILEVVPSARLRSRGAARLVDAYVIEQAVEVGNGQVLCRNIGVQNVNGHNFIWQEMKLLGTAVK